MQKEDQYQLSREQVIHEKFEETRYDSGYAQDKLTTQENIINEVKSINEKHDERIKTAKSLAKQAQEAELEELRKFKEKREKEDLNHAQNARETHAE